MSDEKPVARIRVVIVDDHPSYAHGLETLLGLTAPDIEVVAVSTEIDDALKQVEAAKPDVVIMDAQMPRESEGITAAADIIGRYSDVKVMILTAAESKADARAAMAAGVSGFILKDMPVDELVSAIRLVHGGDVIVSPGVIQTLLETETDPASQLTEWELTLLRLVAEGKETAEIAKQLSVSESTFKRSLRTIEDKLKARNRVQAAVNAAREGLI